MYKWYRINGTTKKVRRRQIISLKMTPGENVSILHLFKTWEEGRIESG